MTRQNWRERFGHFVDGLKGERVYVTVDLDCLRAEEAITNWENGLFTAEDVAWRWANYTYRQKWSAAICAGPTRRRFMNGRASDSPAIGIIRNFQLLIHRRPATSIADHWLGYGRHWHDTGFRRMNNRLAGHACVPMGALRHLMMKWTCNESDAQ